MDAFAQTLLPYILLYKYWALFSLTFIASLAVPIPAGLLLVATSAFASQGYFSIWVVILVAIAANVAGDTLCYFIARYYGTKFLRRVGLGRVLDSGAFKSIERRFRSRPGFVIFVSRFEAFATLSVNLLSGLSDISYLHFALFEGMGALVDSTLYGMVGYIFGSSWEAVNTLLGRFFLVVFLVLILCVIIFWKKLDPETKKAKA